MTYYSTLTMITPDKKIITLAFPDQDEVLTMADMIREDHMVVFCDDFDHATKTMKEIKSNLSK